MDGFNVTLKDTPVTYIPDYTPDMISIRAINIGMEQEPQTKAAKTAEQQFSLLIDLDLERSLLFSDLLKTDLSFFVACSECAGVKWLNESRVTCQLPRVAVANLTTAESCEPKVVANVLANLDMNRLQLINGFVGNYLVRAEHKEEELDENLRIYMQTYALNNVDRFDRFSRSIAARTTSTNQVCEYVSWPS